MRRTVLALLTATMLAVTVAGGTALAAIESGTDRADDLVGTGDHDNLKGWGATTPSRVAARWTGSTG